MREYCGLPESVFFTRRDGEGLVAFPKLFIRGKLESLFYDSVLGTYLIVKSMHVACASNVFDFAFEFAYVLFVDGIVVIELFIPQIGLHLKDFEPVHVQRKCRNQRTHVIDLNFLGIHLEVCWIESIFGTITQPVRLLGLPEGVSLKEREF
jgi:hypothetical protein